MRSYHEKLLSGCSAEGHVSNVLSDRLIELVRYSREQRMMKRTGTDDAVVRNVSMREIMTEHYDQSKSYIDRLQATIPGLTGRKTASIRTRLRLL